MHPKDKRDPLSTTGCIYEVPCANCKESYVDETGRRLETRLTNIRKKLKKLKKVKEVLLAKPENNQKVSSLNPLSLTTRSSITTLLIGKMQKPLQGVRLQCAPYQRSHLDQTAWNSNLLFQNTVLTCHTYKSIMRSKLTSSLSNSPVCSRCSVCSQYIIHIKIF